MNDDLTDIVIEKMKLRSKPCPECGEKSLLPYGLHIFNECKFWKIVDPEDCEDLSDEQGKPKLN